MNLHDRVNDVLFTVNEYDKFYNFPNDDIDYDDNTEEEMHKDDIVLDSHIALWNDSKGDDNKVNVAFEVPIASNSDVPFVSACGIGSVPIVSNVEDRHKHDHVRNESDSQIMRAQKSQVVS